MTQNLCYLEPCRKTATIYVHPEKRNWAGPETNDQHFEYHTHAVKELESIIFSIDVDASKVPYSALLHAPLFIRLAKHARENYKERLHTITIRNASAPAKYIVKALTAARAIPHETAKKIRFVETNHKKSL